MPSSSGTVVGRSGSKWKQTRHDPYYFLAKEQGYRSRAAFKLIQINKKFDFLSKCRAVIDLCAAPGGWLQVCQKLMPASSQIIGVDLLPIKKIPNVVTFTEDITSDKCVALVKKELRDGMVDVVLHDGAPNVGGATWARDAYQQIELVMFSLKMATQFLRQGGTFVTKVFRSQDYDALLWVLKQFFKTITVTKPASSRTASAEIFVVCQGYLAPKKIDPKLLSSSHIFSSTETHKAIDVLHDKAPKKNREGYSDDAGSLLYTKGSVSEFIEGSAPGEILGKYNAIVFDEKSQAYLNHPTTTVEIKELCRDLKVLGMSDFSALMKWRKKLLNWKKEQEELSKPKKQKTEGDDEKMTSALTKEEKEELDDQQVSEQLDALREKKAREEKRAKKLKQERAAKAKKRRELNKHNEGAAEEEEEGLFELGTLKNQEGGLVRDINSGKQGSVVDAEWALHKQREEEEALRNQSESEDENAMEKELAAMYEQYKQRRNIVVKNRPKVGLGDDDEIGADEGQPAGKRKPVKSFPMTQDERWFDRDVFKDVLEPTKAKKDPDASSDDDDDDDDDEEDEQQGGDDEEEEEEEEEAPTIMNAAQKQSQKLLKKKQQEKAQFASPTPGIGSVLESDEEGETNEKGDFEVVPASDYSSDSDAQAERMALGTMMLRKRKRNEVIEGAYNRYAFNDFEALPDWFRDEEGMHNVASLPITKEMVQAFKSQQKAINVRTSKKVLEAVGRKRKKASQQYEKLKNKAAKIGSETTFKDKMKIYESLAKKKTFKNKRPDKEYVVGKKAGGVQSLKKKSGDKGRKGNKVTKVVDRRQRKDARGMKASSQKKSGKGRKGGKR